MRNTIAWRTVALAAAVVLGCHRHETPPPESTARQVPEGEVWLTPAATEHMGLTLAPAREEPVDDTIVTSGRVTFDDLRVTHVFSPVSGRITRIFANLEIGRAHV